MNIVEASAAIFFTIKCDYRLFDSISYIKNSKNIANLPLLAWFFWTCHSFCRPNECVLSVRENEDLNVILRI